MSNENQTQDQQTDTQAVQEEIPHETAILKREFGSGIVSVQKKVKAYHDKAIQGIQNYLDHGKEISGSLPKIRNKTLKKLSYSILPEYIKAKEYVLKAFGRDNSSEDTNKISTEEKSTSPLKKPLDAEILQDAKDISKSAYMLSAAVGSSALLSDPGRSALKIIAKNKMLSKIGFACGLANAMKCGIMRIAEDTEQGQEMMKNVGRGEMAVTALAIFNKPLLLISVAGLSPFIIAGNEMSKLDKISLEDARQLDANEQLDQIGYLPYAVTEYCRWAHNDVFLPEDANGGGSSNLE